MVMTVWSWPTVKGKGQSVQKLEYTDRRTDKTDWIAITFLADAVGLNFKDFYRKSKRNDRGNVGKFSVLYFTKSCVGNI